MPSEAMITTDAQQKKQQEEWMAEEDARALAKVLVIQKDKDRHKQAKAGAKRILKRDMERLKDQEQELDALKEVAGLKQFVSYEKERMS